MTPQRLPLLGTTLALLTATTPAQADPCDATTIVASVHDHYHAILTEDPETRARAAGLLYALLPRLNAAALAHQMSTDDLLVDADRMDRLFSAAERLSRDLITGKSDTMVALAPHLANTNWLASRIADTNCIARFAPPPDETAETTGADGTGTTEQVVGTALKVGLGALLVILGVGALGGLIWFFQKSRTYKIIRADRLPRHMTSIQVDINYETPMRGAQSIRVTGLDVSLGGMKFAWVEAPPKGTELTLHLPLGDRMASIVWSNAHYAGIVFEKQLEDDELAALLG